MSKLRLKWINFWKRIRLGIELKKEEFFQKVADKVSDPEFCTLKEARDIKAFQREHMDCYRKPDAKAHRIGFTIHQEWGSGIGISTTVTCDCCGAEKNVTDFDVW